MTSEESKSIGPKSLSIEARTSILSLRPSVSSAPKSYAQVVESDVANERKLTYKSSFGKTEEIENEIIMTGDCKLNHILVLHQEILCCHTSQDGRLFAIGLLGGGIRVYDPPVISCLYVLSTKDVLKIGLPVTAIKFQPSLKQGALKSHVLVSSYSSGIIKFWNVENKECLYTFEEDRQTLCMAFSRDGAMLTTAGVQGRLYVYNVESKQMVMILEASESRATITGHKSRVFSLCYHPLDFHNLLSGGWDSVINVIPNLFGTTDKNIPFATLLGHMFVEKELI
uniref:Anaphase-promoting complex subunit 4 WD40 domain-containing protein n=1 Tax=Strigamia maritima TaxID=126957 RepID=T1J9Y1_STRMM